MTWHHKDVDTFLFETWRAAGLRRAADLRSAADRKAVVISIFSAIVAFVLTLMVVSLI